MVNKHSDIHFLIVGDGMFKQEVSSLARKLGVLNRNFWMVAPVAKNLLPDVLAAATVASSFVIDVPELWHNSANKFFDSLASGTPIPVSYTHLTLPTTPYV